MPETSRTARLGYRIREVCEATGLGRTTVYSLIASEQLEVVHVGRCAIVTASSLEALRKSRKSSEA